MAGTDPVVAGKSADDSDPITEVIDIPASALADPGTGARRYTAPGFDAGFTQIIDRVPDDPTESIATGTRSRSAPRSIPGRRRRRTLWRWASALVVAGLAIAAIVGGLMYKRSADRAAQDRAVRASIESFDTALREGDLATLRGVTCGKLNDTYVKYDDRTWTDTYAKIMAAKQYPVVGSIDEVVVNGDHAEANVTSYMAFEPATTSTHSFDLQFRDDQWKICQSS